MLSTAVIAIAAGGTRRIVLQPTGRARPLCASPQPVTRRCRPPSHNTGCFRIRPHQRRSSRAAFNLIADEFAAALPLVSDPAVNATPLAGYGRLYAAVALSGLQRHAEADAILRALVDTEPDGYLAEAALCAGPTCKALLREAERAVDILDDLSDEKLLGLKPFC